MLTSVDRQNAARDQRDQGLPPEGAAEGRQERQDQAELRECQIQGKDVIISAIFGEVIILNLCQSQGLVNCELIIRSLRF